MSPCQSQEGAESECKKSRGRDLQTTGCQLSTWNVNQVTEAMNSSKVSHDRVRAEYLKFKPCKGRERNPGDAVVMLKLGKSDWLHTIRYAGTPSVS